MSVGIEMKGDVALAGFVLTAEEWQALDAVSRAHLIAIASPQDGWVVAPLAGASSEPVNDNEAASR